MSADRFLLHHDWKTNREKEKNQAELVRLVDHLNGEDKKFLMDLLKADLKD